MLALTKMPLILLAENYMYFSNWIMLLVLTKNWEIIAQKFALVHSHILKYSGRESTAA